MFSVNVSWCALRKKILASAIEKLKPKHNYFYTMAPWYMAPDHDKRSVWFVLLMVGQMGAEINSERVSQKQKKRRKKRGEQAPIENKYRE
jgi:hypothetical protein